jgi:putative transposase
MIKSHKIRLNPTTEQEIYFKKACGIARFTYNWVLGEWKKGRNNDKKKTIGELKAMLNHDKTALFPWMYEVTKCAPEYAIIDLQKAFANHFKNKKHFKFPTFKAKKRDPMRFGVDNCNYSVEKHNLIIAKMDEPVNMAEELRFLGKLIACRVSYKAGHWYAAITVDTTLQNPPLKLGSGTPPATENTLGIDLGVKTLVTLSNGQKFENQKFLEQAYRKVAHLQRKLSRSKKGGKNREKVVLKLGKAHEKVSDLRGDFYHKMVNEILDIGFDLIGVEDLNVKGMMKNHKLARCIADASFCEFMRILTYKAAQRGTAVVEVGRYYPSSQICFACKHQYKELTLDMREWTCPKCGTHHDRDENASKNIRDEPVRLFLHNLLVAQEQSLKEIELCRGSGHIETLNACG